MFRGKNFVSGLLNVLGMTAAFAALYVILVQVHHDFSYNRGLKDHERLYAVFFPDFYGGDTYSPWMCRPVGDGLMNCTPAIEAGGTGYLFGNSVDIYIAEDVAGEGSEESYNRQMKSSMTSFSDGAVEAFGLEFIKGSFADVLPTERHVAISESAASKFGLDLGSTFMIRQGGYAKSQYEVRAIYKDLPDNTDFDSFEIISNNSLNSLDDWSEWGFPYYCRLSEGAAVEELVEACGKYLSNLAEELRVGGMDQRGDQIETLIPRLIPVADTYFATGVENLGATGNKTTTITLLAVAVLVILIALINFVNFFFALVPVRIRAVNTKKILGSTRGGIVVGFIVESLLMILVSFALAAAVVILFKNSSLSNLISCSIAFGENVGMALLTVLIAVLISIVASIYPAFYITSFPPALVVNGSFGASRRGMILRYTLIGLQFVISIVLIICAVFINMQRSYMMKHDMGFDRENLLVTTVSWPVAYYSADALENTLRNSSLVKDVTWANGDIVQQTRMGWGRPFKDDVIHFQCYPVAWDFLRVMGIEVVEGRDFTEADEQSEYGVFIFNGKARDEFGLTLEDKVSGHITDTDIAGFCENFNFQSLQSEVTPFALYIFGRQAWRKNNTLFVRTHEGVDMAEAMALIRDAVAEVDKETSADQVMVEIFNRQLAKSYYKEQNLSELITIFTVLAIIISLMGVFGLVMFETEYRRKEIGVRRVNGATVGQILSMFNMKFVRIVLICFVIAAPLSWCIMDRYLSGYAYRVPLYIWVFLAALLAVLAVTVGVVTLRSYRASTQNLVDALRNE